MDCGSLASSAWEGVESVQLGRSSSVRAFSVHQLGWLWSSWRWRKVWVRKWNEMMVGCFTSELLESVPAAAFCADSGAGSWVRASSQLTTSKQQNRFLTCWVEVVLSQHRLDIIWYISRQSRYYEFWKAINAIYLIHLNISLSALSGVRFILQQSSAREGRKYWQVSDNRWTVWEMMETKRRPKRQRPRCQVYQEFRRKASDNLKKDEFKIRVDDYTLYRSKVRSVYRK